MAADRKRREIWVQRYRDVGFRDDAAEKAADVEMDRIFERRQRRQEKNSKIANIEASPARVRNPKLLKVANRIRPGVGGVYVIRPSQGVIRSKIGRSSDLASRLRSHAVTGIEGIGISGLIVVRLLVCERGLEHPLEALMHWIFRSGRLPGTEVFRDIPGCVPEQFQTPSDVFEYAGRLVRRRSNW